MRAHRISVVYAVSLTLLTGINNSLTTIMNNPKFLCLNTEGGDKILFSLSINLFFTNVKNMMI